MHSTSFGVAILNPNIYNSRLWLAASLIFVHCVDCNPVEGHRTLHRGGYNLLCLHICCNILKRPHLPMQNEGLYEAFTTAMYSPRALSTALFVLEHNKLLTSSNVVLNLAKYLPMTCITITLYSDKEICSAPPPPPTKKAHYAHRGFTHLHLCAGRRSQQTGGGHTAPPPPGW